MSLPAKLGKEPLVDAVFEMRFSASASASTVLPGVFFGLFGRGEQEGDSPLQFERLPASDIPEAIRNSDPTFQFQPLVRLVWKNFLILISDSSVAVACKMPYPGWMSFKGAILKVVEGVFNVGFLKKVERFSLKYVDLIQEDDLGRQVSSLDWHVRVGGHELKKEVASIRVEIPLDGIVHCVSVQTGVRATLFDGSNLQGVVVDVDSVNNYSTDDIEKFRCELPSFLEQIHSSSKAVFFECLAKETLNSLDPSYE